MNDMREQASELFDCELITRHGLKALVDDRLRLMNRVEELERQNARLISALRHEPWWKRRRA